MSKSAKRADRAAILAASLGAAILAAPAGAEWLDEIPITETGTDSETGLNHTPLAYDAEGGLTVVWAERDTPNQNYQIYARRRPWAAFGPPALLVAYPDPQPGSLLGAKFPSIAALGADSLAIAWHDYRHGGITNSEIYWRTMALGGGLGGELRLTTTLNTANPGDNGYVPTVIVAAGGEVHVAWYDFRWDQNRADIFHKRRSVSGWVTPLGDSADVNVAGGVRSGYDAGAPALAAAAGGVVIAVWADRRGAEARIRMARYAPGTGWGTPETVASPAGASVEAPAAAVAPDGILHVVWVDGRHAAHTLYTRTRSANGTYGAELLLTNPAVEAGEPALSATADGALHLVWQDARVSLDNREIFYRRRPPGGAWDTSGGSDVRISNAGGRSDRPSIAADPELDLAVLWRDRRSGASELFLREFRPGGPIAVADPGRRAGGARLAGLPLVRGPNPFGRRLALAGPPGEWVIIADPAGRIVERLAPGASSWDGRSAAGAEVPPGVYFLRAPVSGRVARVVRLP